MSIEIPLHSTGDEVLEIQLDNLPDEVELVSALKGERVQLKTWIDLAQQYYLQHKYEAFKYILETATDPSTENDYEATPQLKVLGINSLAAYHLKLAETEAFQSDASKAHLQEAIALYNRSARLDPKCEATLTGQGLVNVLKRDLARAETQFKTVTEQSADNAPALLGRANVLQLQKKWPEALELYKKVLRNHPGCPANVRLGIGQCYFNIGRLDMAKKAFQRTLDLDNTNIGALTGLAVLNLNGDEDDSLLKGMRLISHGFEIDPNNSIVLNHLANHYFHRGELQKCFALASEALQNTNMTPIKADAAYSIARCYQSINDYENALTWYYKAYNLHSELTVAAYGLGQMYLYKKDLGAAAGVLEEVIKACPDNYESTKMLASIYGQTGKTELARKYFKKVVDERPNDVDAWVEYSRYLEETDLPKALEACEKAESLLKEQIHTEVPAELWNNIATLQTANGKLEEAYENYQKAMTEYGKKQESADMDEFVMPLGTTIRYNIARAHELKGERATAEAMYKQLVKDHPTYIESYLRLGCMLRDQGRKNKASDWFKEALSVDVSDYRTRSLLGNLHLSKGEIIPAQKMFESINKDSKEKTKREDMYAQVALGSLFHQSASTAKRNDPKGAQKHADYLRRAQDLYAKALKLDGRNMYAANGIGCVLAERGHVNEARQIFVQVREATGDMPFIWDNLAHTNLQQKQYVNAIKMLKTCQARFFGGRDVDVYISIARAYFLSNDFAMAAKTLRKALHITPTDSETEYNIGLCEQKVAVAVLKDTKSDTTQLLMAKRSAKMAERIFTMLAQSNDKHTKYSKTLAKMEAKRSSQLLDQCIWTYNYQAKKEGKRDEERQRAQEKNEALRREQMEARRLAEEREREENERLEQQRHELIKNELATQAEIRERKALEDAQRLDKAAKKGSGKKGGEGGRGRKKGSKGDPDVDGFVVNDELEEGMQRMPNSSDESDAKHSGAESDASGGRRSKKRKSSKDSDDDKPKRKGRKMVRHSKELIEDSDADAMSDREQSNHGNRGDDMDADTVGLSGTESATEGGDGKDVNISDRKGDVPAAGEGDSGDE